MVEAYAHLATIQFADQICAVSVHKLFVNPLHISSIP